MQGIEKVKDGANQEKDSNPQVTSNPQAQAVLVTEIANITLPNATNKISTETLDNKTTKDVSGAVEELPGANEDEEDGSESGSEYTAKSVKVTTPRRKCPVSPTRLATLENLSYEIMTNTLPIAKMKRILPDEQLRVQEKWPILSNYRKETVLPSVKAGKQRLTADMSKLHTKLNDYFQCDNFPLWQYKYVPPAYPTRYRLLKAIETESIQLPTLPKH